MNNFSERTKLAIELAKIDKQIIIATNGNIHNDFEKIINESF